MWNGKNERFIWIIQVFEMVFFFGYFRESIFGLTAECSKEIG